MVTRQQVERLEQRIEGLAARQGPLAPIEHWFVDRGTARCAATGEEIPEPELEGRPCAGRMRIVSVYVDPRQTPAGRVA